MKLPKELEFLLLAEAMTIYLERQDLVLKHRNNNHPTLVPDVTLILLRCVRSRNCTQGNSSESVSRSRRRMLVCIAAQRKLATHLGAYMSKR
jgi:hypothetical protein